VTLEEEGDLTRSEEDGDALELGHILSDFVMRDEFQCALVTVGLETRHQDEAVLHADRLGVDATVGASAESAGRYRAPKASPSPRRVGRLDSVQLSALALVLPELPECRLRLTGRTGGVARVVDALSLRLLDGFLVPANRLHHSSVFRGADGTILGTQAVVVEQAGRANRRS